MATMY